MLVQCFNLKEFTIFREIFEKPIRYVVNPTKTYNYSVQVYDPPTDSLIQATLSIASNSTNGLIIWHDINNPTIQDYLVNRDDKQYLSKIFNTKELQIREEEEEMMTTTNSKKSYCIHQMLNKIIVVKNGLSDIIRHIINGTIYRNKKKKRTNGKKRY